MPYKHDSRPLLRNAHDNIWCGPHAAGVLTGAGPRVADRVLEKIQGGPVVATYVAPLCECLRTLGWKVTSLRNFQQEDQSLIDNCGLTGGGDFIYVVSCGRGLLDAGRFGEHLAQLEASHAVAVRSDGMINDSTAPFWQSIKHSPWQRSRVQLRISTTRNS